MLHVPFPKSSDRTFVTALAAIAAIVVFILTVFEPFGTSDFEHEYKTIILAGYGIVSFVVGVAYHYTVTHLLPAKYVDRWSIVHEVMYVFCCLMCCILGCFLYWQTVFSIKPSVSATISFLGYATAVAVVPMLGYLALIYSRYREVRYAMPSADQPSAQHSSYLEITGRNKNEQLRLEAKCLRYVQSSDNYVILHLHNGEKITKKMLRNTISAIEQQLTDDFVKVHRQYLVNATYIKGMTGNITNSRLTLDGVDKQIPVSRSRVPSLRELL